MNGTPSNHERQLQVDKPYLGVFLLATAVCVPFFVLIHPGARMADASSVFEWMAISPFGTVGVVGVHVLATFPLSWTIARIIRPRLGQATVPRVGCCAIVAGMVAVATLYGGTAVGEAIVQSSAGARFLLRVVWTIGMQVPWCMAAVILLVPAEGEDRVGTAWVMILLLGATLLPMTHANHVTRKEIGRVEDYLAKQQYLLAWNHLVALESLAGVQQVAQRPSDALRVELAQQLTLLQQQARQPLADDAPVEAVIERAALSVSLNELDQAQMLLESVQARRPDVFLLLAAVHEERRDSAAAVAALSQAADLIGDAKGSDAEAIGRQVYQRWAQNLRLLGRYPEAQQRLREAVDRFENSQGFFLFELGLHNQMGGRFKTALDYYESAAKADPRYQQRVAAAIGKLKKDTPVCILRPAKLATR